MGGARLLYINTVYDAVWAEIQVVACEASMKAGINGGSSHSGRRTLAARILAQTGRVDDVQQELGHVDLDHSCPYLDVDPTLIRRAFELAL